MSAAFWHLTGSFAVSLCDSPVRFDTLSWIDPHQCRDQIRQTIDAVLPSSQFEILADLTSRRCRLVRIVNFCPAEALTQRDRIVGEHPYFDHPTGAAEPAKLPIQCRGNFFQ